MSTQNQRYHAKLNVMLKNGVLDPQGKAVSQGLLNLGFDSVHGVRVGKLIEVEFDAPNEEKAKELLTQMAEKLLANTVIERYTFELSQGKTSK